MSEFQSGPGFFPAVAVGGYQLELGSSDGTFVLFEPESEHEQANALGAALRAPEATEVPEPTATDRLEEVLGEASTLTEHSQRCLRLFTEIAEGSRDPHAISDEIDALLALLGRLDREGKHKEVLRLARDLAALLALLLRWLDLVRSLELALRTARALGDQRAVAWALHELGTLQLAAGDATSAADRLQEAVRLKEQVGGRGRCASRHNLDAARRDLADRAALERVQRRRLFRIVGAGAILVFLAGGGIALGITSGSHKPVDGSATGPPTPSTSSTGRAVAASARLNLGTSGSGSGRITRDPGGISCGDGCWSYGGPTTVILRAVADPGSAFDGWQDACAGTTGDSCTVKISGATTVSASFTGRAVAASARLNLGTSGSGSGRITRDPGGISCGDGCWSYGGPTTVILRAVADPGSAFDGWQDACAGTTGDSCTVKISGATTVSASFTGRAVAAPARLNLGTSGSGSGRITRDPGGISCGDGCWSYGGPTTVILRAVADPGSAFDGWQDACAGTTGDSCTLKISSATTVSATFDQFYNLTVTLTPVGSGTVNFSPEAASCGEGCWRYRAGTIVMLKAVPTRGSGYFFSGWQGDCKGTTGDSCTLTINGNTSVTAAFDHLR